MGLGVQGQTTLRNGLVRGYFGGPRFHVFCLVYYFFILIIDVLFVSGNHLTTARSEDSADEVLQAQCLTQK